MKKIGIVTIVDNYNFGNRLQNYAVYRYFQKEHGVKAVTLSSHIEKRFGNSTPLSGLKDSAVLMLSRFPGIVEKRFSPRVNRWVSFIKWSGLIPTKHYYSSYDLPEKLGEEYDHLFAGSDQIWNYSFSSDRFYDYFLQFADPDKRASLSASFGVEEIPEEWKESYKQLLSGMRHISVREDAGAKIVKELTGRDVPVLVDPVMMLDREEWLAVSRKPRVDCSVPYVLKYYLGDEDDQKVDRWAEQNGYKVYELMKEGSPELYSAGPGEFLSLIDSAALVCSDSFHCIAFSILFRKPFIVYARKGELNNLTSRMDTLLRKFGFQDRWDYLLREEDYLKCDFGMVADRLKAERREFHKYIAKALEKDGAKNPCLADKTDCIGCTACAGICPAHCIRMVPDRNGFRYPIIDSAACIGCGACERTCPVLNDIPKSSSASAEAYAAYSLDEPMRMQSSSGGVFTEIAKTVLSKGGAVYGAAYDKDFNVYHCAAESPEELEALRGAKYAESRLGDVFPEIKARLNRGQEVLFSGTPCQVGGLKAFLGKDYENLLTVDFVCHGIPSPMVWRSWLQMCTKTDEGGKTIEEIDLRDKSTGWSRYRYSNRIRFIDGSEYSVSSSNSLYMRLFVGDYILRSSCYDCRFKGYERPSDITIGDFWGIWDIAPEMDDDRGTSLVLLRSAKGKSLWKEVRESLEFKPMALQEASASNISLIKSAPVREEREKVLKAIREQGIQAGESLLEKQKRSVASKAVKAVKRRLKV